MRVALTERVSAVVDGRRWVHEAVLWLAHEANTDLDVALPEGARVLGVTVDGLPVTPLQASADDFGTGSESSSSSGRFSNSMSSR